REVRRLLVHEARRVALADLVRQPFRVVALTLAPAGAHRVDALALRGQVGAREEPLDRRIRAEAVGEPIGRGELDRLDQVVQVLDRVVPPSPYVETVEDAERLEALPPDRARRRHSSDVVAAIPNADRL